MARSSFSDDQSVIQWPKAIILMRSLRPFINKSSRANAVFPDWGPAIRASIMRSRSRCSLKSIPITERCRSMESIASWLLPSATNATACCWTSCEATIGFNAEEICPLRFRTRDSLASPLRISCLQTITCIWLSCSSFTAEPIASSNISRDSATRPSRRAIAPRT